MYYRETRSPNSQDLELIELATHLVRVAIERDRAETALRASEQVARARQVPRANAQYNRAPFGGAKRNPVVVGRIERIEKRHEHGLAARLNVSGAPPDRLED